MKKTISILAAFAVALSMTGCSQNETSEPVVTTTNPIYVDMDGLDYAENEVIGSVTSATDTEGNPIETEDNPSTSKPSGGGTPITTTKPSGGGGHGGNPTYPTNPEDPKDSVYNTTVEPNIEETANIRFGDVEVVYKYKDEGYAIGETVTLGVNPYGFCLDILATKGVTFVDAPLEIEVTPSEHCEYEFIFNGAGHTLKETDTEKATMYMELENENGDIIDIDKVKSIGGIESYSVDVKAMASVLDEEIVVGISSIGKLRLDTNIEVKYEVITPDFPADTPMEIFIGSPYTDLVAAIGEGTEIRTADGEQIYYVYKTVDHTLVVQHDIIEYDAESEYAVESSDVLTTIILIKNEVEHEEETAEAEEVEELVLVPVTDINVDETVNLSYLKINGKQVKIYNKTLKNFLSETGFEHCANGTTTLKNDVYAFESNMFGIPSSGDTFDGTLLSVEVEHKQTHTHIAPVDFNINDAGMYFIKGIYISEFWKKDDIKISFCEGITIGTPKEDVVAALGEGTQMDNGVIYKNKDYTLVIEYKYGDSGKVVESVCLLVNQYY